VRAAPQRVECRFSTFNAAYPPSHRYQDSPSPSARVVQLGISRPGKSLDDGFAQHDKPTTMARLAGTDARDLDNVLRNYHIPAALRENGRQGCWTPWRTPNNPSGKLQNEKRSQPATGPSSPRTDRKCRRKIRVTITLIRTAVVPRIAGTIRRRIRHEPGMRPANPPRKETPTMQAQLPAELQSAPEHHPTAIPQLRDPQSGLPIADDDSNPTDPMLKNVEAKAGTRTCWTHSVHPSLAPPGRPATEMGT